MPDKGLPRLMDLDPATVRQGRGWFIGELQNTNTALKSFLRPPALVGRYDSVKIYFDSIDELGWKPGGGPKGNQFRQSGKQGKGGFNHFESFDKARAVYSFDPKSIRKFSEEDLQLKAEENIGKDVRFDVTGDYIDIGKFLEGVPEVFGVSYQGNPAGLYVTILINSVAVWSTNEKILNHKQARVLRLVDWMEAQGVRAKIVTLMGTECGYQEITVKDFHEQVDMNWLAVAGHSDFFRRMQFLFLEQSKTIQSGYGQAYALTTAMQENYQAQAEDGLTVFISDSRNNDHAYVDQQFDTLRDKIDAVLDQPAEQRDFDKVYAVQL